MEKGKHLFIADPHDIHKNTNAISSVQQHTQHAMDKVYSHEIIRLIIQGARLIERNSEEGDNV